MRQTRVEAYVPQEPLVSEVLLKRHGVTLNMITGWVDVSSHGLSVRLSRPEVGVLNALMAASPSGVSTRYLVEVMRLIQRRKISPKTVSTYMVFLRRKLTSVGLCGVIIAEREGLYRFEIGSGASRHGVREIHATGPAV